MQEIGHADEDHLHAREANGRYSSAASGDSHGTSNLTLDRTCRRGPYPPRRPSSARAIWPLRVAWHPLASQPPPGASPPPRRAAPPSESPPRVSAGTRIDPDPSPSTRALDPPYPRRRRRRPRRTTGAPRVTWHRKQTVTNESARVSLVPIFPDRVASRRRPRPSPPSRRRPLTRPLPFSAACSIFQPPRRTSR